MNKSSSTSSPADPTTYALPLEADECEDLTEAEHDAVTHVMLKAAIKALGELKTADERGIECDYARRVLHAMAAANTAKRAECERLKAMNKNAYVHTETHEVVATAFYMWTEEITNMDDAAPRSIAGARLLGFARGIMAANSATRVIDLLEEDDTYLLVGDRGAQHLALQFPVKP